MRHIPLTPLPGTFSFATPCLRWKILSAVKNQHGFPSHTPPYANRFLNLLVTITTDERPLGPGFPVNTVSQLFTIDPANGFRTPASLNQAGTPLLNFPYNTGLPASDPSSSWTITETEYTHVVQLPSGIIVTTNGQLSNEYTLSKLESDTDALIAAIDATKVPEFTLMLNTTGDPPAADPTGGLPAQYLYGSLFQPYPLPIPVLRAAAWYAYVFGSVGPFNWTPNVYMKAIGLIAMAGKYCQKTYWVDASQNLLDQQCVSGVGSCGNHFRVSPPPLVSGENAYVRIIPDCECGG